jgi:uncharacterized protein (DUF433 family)
MTVKTEYPHVVLDEQGVPLIEGTTMKIVELVVARLAYGWSPEELQIQFPHLSPGQVHAALAYYWDHAAELDREIERRVRDADAARKAGTESLSPLRRRLGAQGMR